MARFIYTFLILLGAWLVFTFSTVKNEIIVGIFASAAVAHLSKKFSFEIQKGLSAAHIRLISFFRFTASFILAEIESHASVAKAVITGKINPSILRLEAGTKSAAGKTVLSSAITLTPGTLAVEVNDSLYIHYLDADGGQGTEKKFATFAEKMFG